MYTLSKPDGTMTIIWEDDEWEIIQATAKLRGLEATFLVALALQAEIRMFCELFPRRLLMPGALDREIKRGGIRRNPELVNHG